MAAKSAEFVSLLKSEKENLELVNSNLLRVLEKKELEIVSALGNDRVSYIKT